jgi:hypothetical protein
VSHSGQRQPPVQVKQTPESDLREVRRIVLDKLRVYPADIRYSVPARGNMRRFSDIDAAILPPTSCFLPACSPASARPWRKVTSSTPSISSIFPGLRKP